VITAGIERIDDLVAVGAPAQAAVIAADGAPTTFEQLQRHCAGIAGWIDAHSARGDRIAIVADNCPHYVAAYYAVPRAGRILALINQRLSPAEQLAAIDAAQPRILLAQPHYIAALASAARQMPTLDTVVDLHSQQWHDIAGHPAYVGPPAAADEVAWLIFTSGSTGRPKGVLHTHRSLLAAVRGTVEGRGVPPGDVYLFPFPMCHIAGYNVLVRHATGSTVVLSPHFRAAEFVAAVNDHGVQSCSLAPTMLHALLGYVESTGAVMPTLREIAYGSAAISTDLIDRATKRLRVDFHQGYGMTETGGNVTFLGPAEHRAAVADPAILRTAGTAHRGVQIAIAGDDGPVCAPGQLGEIVVRGEQVMAGYWRDDAASREAFIDGWLRTGDIGRIDDAGVLSIVDRCKDVIITGGENVSSREVEDALSTHGGIDMVAVVGVPDPYWGEAICAVVVRADPALQAHEVIEYARGRISPFKRPRHVLFVEELPLTSNGKIAKEQVRAVARERIAHPGR
jgi:acyl-CoA synthetase (AMP-forming)/AMP-acid ligase II